MNIFFWRLCPELPV